MCWTFIETYRKNRFRKTKRRRNWTKSSVTETETEQKRSEQNICFPDSVGLQSQSVAVEVVLLFFSQKKFQHFFFKFFYQVFNANTSVHFFGADSKFF